MCLTQTQTKADDEVTPQSVQGMCERAAAAVGGKQELYSQGGGAVYTAADSHTGRHERPRKCVT